MTAAELFSSEPGWRVRITCGTIRRVMNNFTGIAERANTPKSIIIISRLKESPSTSCLLIFDDDEEKKRKKEKKMRKAQITLLIAEPLEAFNWWVILTWSRVGLVGEVPGLYLSLPFFLVLKKANTSPSVYVFKNRAEASGKILPLITRLARQFRFPNLFPHFIHSSAPDILGSRETNLKRRGKIGCDVMGEVILSKLYHCRAIERWMPNLALPLHATSAHTPFLFL